MNKSILYNDWLSRTPQKAEREKIFKNFRHLPVGIQPSTLPVGIQPSILPVGTQGSILPVGIQGSILKRKHHQMTLQTFRVLLQQKCFRHKPRNRVNLQTATIKET